MTLYDTQNKRALRLPYLTRLQGRVTSFLGSDLQRYTSFKAHLSSDGPVRQILVNDKGVITLGSNDVHMAQRRGPTIWHIKYCHLGRHLCYHDR